MASNPVPSNDDAPSSGESSLDIDAELPASSDSFPALRAAPSADDEPALSEEASSDKDSLSALGAPPEVPVDDQSFPAMPVSTGDESFPGFKGEPPASGGDDSFPALEVIGVSSDIEVEVEPDSFDELSEDDPKRRLGGYILDRRIAQGGMAQIFLARRVGPAGFSKTVVIKRMLPHLTENQDYAKMFIREAQIAAGLDHENIVSVFEFGEQDNDYFIAMEYVDGLTLSNLLRRLKLEGEEAWRLASAVAIQICRALQYAHDARNEDYQHLGLVHRDVSPGNVLVSKSGAAKLADFGIVKMTKALSEEKTQIGVMKGKAGYMSPEQARAQVVDHRSDIFSLGIITYEAALGRKLFKRGDSVQSILAIVGGDIPPPSWVHRGFPQKLEEILGRALRLEKTERWEKAEELGAALADFRRARGWGSPEEDLKSFVKQALAKGSGKSAGLAAMTNETITTFGGGSAGWEEPKKTVGARWHYSAFAIAMTVSLVFWGALLFAS